MTEAGPMLSIVVPCYRSEGCLRELVRAVQAELTERFGAYELLLINDRSPDGTWDVIRELADAEPNVVGIDLRKNVGQDSAIMAGLRHVRGDVVVIMDDDLQHDPRGIPTLVREVAKGHDVAYALFETRKHAWWKNMGSWLADRVAVLLLHKPPDLYMSPFKAMSRGVADAVAAYDGPYTFIDGLILTVTEDLAQVRIEHRERYEGEGNYTLWRSVGVWLKLATNFSVAPLRLATAVGGLIAAISFLTGAYFVMETLITGREVQGWASLIVTLYFLGGVQLVGIGLLGEYVGRLFITVNKRPQFTIREVRGRDEPGGANSSAT